MFIVNSGRRRVRCAWTLAMQFPGQAQGLVPVPALSTRSRAIHPIGSGSGSEAGQSASSPGWSIVSPHRVGAIGQHQPEGVRRCR